MKDLRSEDLKLNVSNVKDNIAMTVVDGKIAVLNMLTFDLTSDEKEVSENNFFASVDNLTDERKECVAFIFANTNGVNAGATEWLMGNGSFNIDKYPDEMADAISMSINTNKGIASKLENKYCVNLSKLDSFSFAEDKKKLTQDAFADLQKQMKKYMSADSVDLEDFLERYYFRKHVLIQGKKGGGKTYAVDKMLRARSVPSEFIAGHEGIEAIDLLGYYVKNNTGNLVWLDGALTRAFRIAQEKPCALFIDETLRIPARELNILVGALTPSSVGTFRLRTNRIINEHEGIGETEVIEIPRENLWCIGTTNVGAGYQVDDIDSALADRFRLATKETDSAELHTILSTYLKDGISSGMVDKLTSFYTKMTDMVASGELEKEVNTRHLCECLELAKDDDDVLSYVADLIPTWVANDTDGKPNRAERDIVKKLIQKTFK